MFKLRRTTGLGVLLILVVLALYRHYGYRPADLVVTEESGEDDSVSVHFYEEEEIEIVAHSNSKQEESTSKVDLYTTPSQENIKTPVPLPKDTLKNRCSNPKSIHDNRADLQVSDLVESLQFRSEDPETGHYPGMKPLPTSEELTVFLVPHSHCDPGWLLQYQEYYEKNVRHILTNFYQFAMEHDDFKYIYAEVSFFKLWWEEQKEKVKENMGLLAREGRFEFVQGGWVQNDEANTHYFAIINQMLDGHQWLHTHFPDAKPRAGWAIDPFGLSPFMAQVNKLFGLDAMHIQRVHYTVKKHLAESRQLEFKWRQSWDSSGETDILTELGAFSGYNSQYTCGPDPDVCLQYHFAAFTNPKFRPHRLLHKTSPVNLKERSLKILDQWRKKAALHSANAVFIELGFDFSYIIKGELNSVYDNYKPLMEYINNSTELNTQVKWGTVSDYFDHIKNKPDKFPTLSGDFFTYADRFDHYWSGYYTTRPFNKNLDRVLESSLRRTEILFSFQRAKEDVKKKKEDVEKLTTARNTLSLFQHHDGITGTAKPRVVDDYGSRLYKAYKACDELSAAAIRHIMADSGADLKPTRLRAASKELEKFRVLEKEVELVVVSTIPRRTSAAQVIAVQAHLSLEVVGSKGEVIPQQVEPDIEYGKLDPKSKLIIFWTELSSVSINTFQLKKAEQVKTTARLNIFGKKSVSSTCEDIVLGQNKLVIKLDCKSGRLKTIEKRGKTVDVNQEVIMYPSRLSGAYLFLPTGDPTQLLTDSTRADIVVVKGSLRDRAMVTLKYQESTLVLTYTVYHHQGSESEYLDLEIMSDLKNNGDLAIRLKTDIKSGDSIYTDLNGHTIQHHKYKSKLKTQGNFFPMPSTAFIQDSSTRLTLLGSEPHGVASLSEGWIEVIIDRRSSHDDGRGLGEGIQDNIPTPAHLRILVEARSETQRGEEGYRVEYPSLVSHWTLQTLLHPAFLLSRPLKQTLPASVQLMKPLPCDEELVNLRYVENQTCQLIRRKLGFTCDIDILNSCDYQDTAIEELFTDNITLEDHPFSPFHHKNDSNKSDFKAMEFSSEYVTFRK